jgi:tetrapyrrole methylase family protein/MazG family protein
MSITIVGLGPGDPAHLTLEAWDVLAQADEVYLRTSQHPTLSGLPSGPAWHSFDHLYETLESLAEVYESIASEILALGRRAGGVVYAVPGHPLMGESSVVHILDRAREEGLAVHVVEGLSFVEPTLSLLGLDGLAGLQLADATELAMAHHPALDPGRPALIAQLWGRQLAGEVKLTLMNAYPDEHEVTLVRGAGTPTVTRRELPLYALDRDTEVDHLTTLYVPPLPGAAGLPALQETVAHLRAPDGCPWDQEQTHQSLRSNFLEEVYEVLAALDIGDDGKLSEELGDLLMQIVMHVQIATEEGAFRFADVIGRIDAKLKRRHPHVFGQVEVEGTADVLHNWEVIKAQERAASEGESTSRLGGVPTALPALARGQVLADRAARSGFDWPSAPEALAAASQGASRVLAAQTPEAREQALGELLFSLANGARQLGVDAEGALRRICDRFTRRYAVMEQEAQARGLDLAALSPDQQAALWQEARNET